MPRGIKQWLVSISGLPISSWHEQKAQLHIVCVDGKKQKGWCVVMESPAVRGVYALMRRHLFSWWWLGCALCSCVCVSTMTISPACLWVQQSKPHKWPTIRQQTHRGNKTARQSDFNTEALELRKWRGKRSFRQPCVPFLMCPVLNWWPLVLKKVSPW